MFIQRALESRYPANIRAQGEELARRMTVQILSGDRWHLEAEVRADEHSLARVEMQRITDSLVADCSCDFFLEYGGCAHIWAAAILADRRGHLTGYGGSRSMLTLREKTKFELLPPEPAKPLWIKKLDALSGVTPPPPPPAPRERSIFYCLAPSYGGPGLSLTIGVAERKLNGEWGKIRESALKVSDLPYLPPHDQQILGLLSGMRAAFAAHSPLTYSSDISGRMLSMLIETAQDGQLLVGVAKRAEDAQPVVYDPGPPWRLHLAVTRDEQDWSFFGEFRRGDETLALQTVSAFIDDRYLLAGGRISHFEMTPLVPWARQLRSSGPIRVPAAEGEAFARALTERAPSDGIQWPDELRFEQTRLVPVPRLRFRPPAADAALRAVLSFSYDGHVFEGESKSRGRFLEGERRFLARNLAEEEEARRALIAAGAKLVRDYTEVIPLWEVHPKRFAALVEELLALGWTVESEGRVVRAATSFHLGVNSEIDWFELKGKVKFDGQVADLPEVLRALRKGEKIVRLGDGTFGMLPEEFLRRYAMLVEIGEETDGQVRYRKSQLGVLDACLAAMPEIEADERLEKARTELQSFAGVAPQPEPPGFQGTLRDYQRTGLGWLDFLRRFGFGGCLADDMGVGKTPQVLAQLERVRGRGVSLVVVPRSLIYNWKEEAARFTPALRVLDYSGASRGGSFEGYDVVLTTYGVLRREAPRLKDFEFEYAILDEAQAIKNANSESAKAARLLRARHRLALSGTPIENHLGELWSLFEFLNPGMLGSARVFQQMSGRTQVTGDETRQLLARALRPFILRRTKGQVARELPERIEQTIYCELEPRQRELYNELRHFYRTKLLKKTGKAFKGDLGKAKLVVLEALLRLRQAACHPALIDAQHAGVPAAKLDTLIENLEQVSEEGHKSLVFSQFTSMLALVRQRLDEAGLKYCYLDGATTDRQAAVKEFQSASGPPVFLISLKAGGVGLNLTAAEYVFLLDPWWNPAAEAQAIDRAHRIGQQSTVFAYRLIAKDTVEERVLELQRWKRELADAILGENNSLIGDLTAEDLDLLLS